jgi:hypothetical protein
MTTVPTRMLGAEIVGARVMAEAWADYYIALWHGDPAASTFAEWLAGYWEPSLHRPAGPADAQSPFAGGFGAIDWFEREGWVTGHIPGQSGGYLIPRATILEFPWVVLEESAA